MTAVHRYIVADLVTDRYLGDLPLGGVSYTRSLVPGDLRGSFAIGSSRLGNLAAILNDRPCSIYALRNSQIWWGGATVQSPRTRASRDEAARCSITAVTFDGWPDRRRIFSDLDYTELDRGDVLARLWARMQSTAVAGPTATINVDPGTPVVGGEKWSGGWAGVDAKPYGEAMREVAAVDPAVEWTVDTWVDSNGVRYRKVRVGTPLLGQQTPTESWRPLLLCTPGRVKTHANIGDHTSRPTHALARGAQASVGPGGEAAPLTSPLVVDADAVAAGYPRIDGLVDVDTEDDARLLDAAKTAVRGRNRLPVIKATLPDGHGFHPGQVGDLARFQIAGPEFPAGLLDDTRRLIAVTVEPAEVNREETVTFTFYDPAGEDAA